MKSVLVDTSVWVDHFRQNNTALVDLLHRDLVMMHPLIVAEIACGTPPHRAQTLSHLARLRPTQQAGIEEVLAFIERKRLFGLGCGVVDITLLACALMTPQTHLWTLDKHLCALAKRFGVMHTPAVY